MLTLNSITYRIAGRTLLDNASLSVPTGSRVGLVGPNGTGKTTLFKIIAKELDIDGGTVELLTKMSVGMVRQDIPHDDTPLIDIVLAADTERTNLFSEAETATDPQRISDIYMRLDDIDAYAAPARAATILTGLGFDTEAQLRPINSFSGGWRMRVALAAALFQAPDLLLLDEPTNHLDFEAIVWLENYLASYRKTFIMISHDRDILNKTVTHIAHLDQQTLTLYTGSYDEFESRRAQKMLNQQALFEKQQAHKQRTLDFVRRFGAKASKARQAQSRIKALEKMNMVDAVIADRTTAFQFPEPTELASPIITLDDADIGYAPGKPILRKVNARIDFDDRIALLGANGNGKSTLIKLLSNTLKPLTGSQNRHGKLRVGYFAQHQTDELDVNATPYEVIYQHTHDRGEAKTRALLGKFGFNKDKADTKVASLSGGEKARLLFCKMSLNAPHIMLLDEPTNHLDIDARQALIQALNAYEGCVVLVSHDPNLIESAVDRLWLVHDGKLTAFEGDLEDYRKFVIEQRRQTQRNQKQDNAQPEDVQPKEKQAVSEEQLKKAEAAMTKWSEAIKTIEAEMTRPKALNTPAYMQDLTEKHALAQQKLADAEAFWLEHQE
jgi:ATP-binding cassette, subfamily F, member 3